MEGGPGSVTTALLNCALYTYDANGNTLSDAQGRSFTWDFENRLTQAIVPGTNGGTTAFKYDPFGRRIQKSGPLGTTNYLYDGPDILEEVNNGGNQIARYTKGPGIDETLAMLRSGSTSYYQADGLGSVTSLSDPSGVLANTYTYDSFGKLSAVTGSLANPFQYTGRESDAETGLYFYRARYADVSIGRFVSEDPIGFEGGGNFYRYVENRSTVAIDPFGEQSGMGPDIGGSGGKPPISVPGQPPSVPWVWVPNDQNDRGGTYQPDKNHPDYQPDPYTPEASWEGGGRDHTGHWDVDYQGDRQRFDWRGNKISPEQAHRKRFCQVPQISGVPGFADIAHEITNWAYEHPVTTAIVVSGTVIIVTVASGGSDIIIGGGLVSAF